MKSRDISKRFFALSILIIIAAKLLLGCTQYVYLTPYSAPIDDMLMFNSAESIAHGTWLGDYSWLTLSKYYFFAVWLAALNLLHIPYLLGGQLLWLVAVGVCTAALSPVLKKNIFKLVFFAVLLFNPAQMAAEVELRVYRDNIFPALCLLCIAGFIGAALRPRARLRNYLAYISAACLGFATAYVTREDGIWLAPFAVGAGVVTVIFMLRDKSVSHKALRSLSLAFPYASAAALVLIFCCINYQYYGRFVFSDYTSREFKDAYGAMTRVEHEDWQMQIAVPNEVRQKLYAVSPSLAIIEPILERNWYYARYGSEQAQELNTGGLHWAIREAAYDAGVYKSAASAREYWQRVALEINTACEDGRLKAGPVRSSTMPPIRAEYILPTIKMGFTNIWQTLTFNEAYPAYDLLSYVSPDEYDGFVNFLRNTPNTSAIAGTALPYYSFVQKIANGILTIFQYAYALVLPVMFLAALVWQCIAGLDFIKRRRRDSPLFYLIMLGLLLAILLRAFMLAFMFVASFNSNIVHVMYLSSIHPIAIIYALLGSGMLAARISAKHKGAKFG